MTFSQNKPSHREKWMASMIARHGSEQAVKEFMKQAGGKAARTGKGGFRWLKENDPNKLKYISQLGGKVHGTSSTDNNSK